MIEAILENLQVAQLGHPILRQRAKLVVDISAWEIQKLVDNMMATVMDVDGVGIAAPQVYQSVRIFITASHPNHRYPDAPEIPPMAIINPKILFHSQKTEKDWEGCLSIPGVRALVPRWTKVKVSYYTREGKKIVIAYDDFLARIFQHELDHLNGKVFFDRLENLKDIYMEKEFQKIIAKRIVKVK